MVAGLPIGLIIEFINHDKVGLVLFIKPINLIGRLLLFALYILLEGHIRRFIVILFLETIIIEWVKLWTRHQL